MRAYSEDLREKIVEAVGRGMSKTAAAEAFGVSRSSVKRYVGATRGGGSLAPKRHPGSRPKLDERARKLLEADVKRRPVASLKQRRRFLRAAAGDVAAARVGRVLLERPGRAGGAFRRGEAAGAEAAGGPDDG